MTANAARRAMTDSSLLTHSERSETMSPNCCFLHPHCWRTVRSIQQREGVRPYIAALQALVCDLVGRARWLAPLALNGFGTRECIECDGSANDRSANWQQRLCAVSVCAGCRYVAVCGMRASGGGGVSGQVGFKRVAWIKLRQPLYRSPECVGTAY